MGIRASTASGANRDSQGSVVHDQKTQRVSACLHSRKGGKKVNQDSAVVHQGYGAEDGIFCGVFDGHGKNGHLVSRLVKARLPSLLLDQMNDVVEMGDNALVKAFTEMDEEIIKLVKRVDASFSGTTAVVVLQQGDELVIANLGDSRAILGTRTKNGVGAVQLTTDLKPGSPDEAARIRRSNGRVFALRDEPDLQRAWLPRLCSPGMAMSRSFGDLVMKKYGIIAIPVVTRHRVTSDDRFIVLATDGIWDVLSNKEVVSIVEAAETEEMAAKAVVDEAIRTWKALVSNDRPDDCTAICLFLRSNHQTQPTTS